MLIDKTEIPSLKKCIVNSETNEKLCPNKKSQNHPSPPLPKKMFGSLE